MKVAIIHEYLTRLGGAERVLKRIVDMYPEASLYTLLYKDEIVKKGRFGDKVQGSFLQNYPKFLKNKPKFLAPLYPTAAESFDLSAYDVVISSSNSFAKGVITNPKTIHICYCHAPSIFSWDAFYSYITEQRRGYIMTFAIKVIAHYIRQWDRQASDRVDIFIANSKTTRARIKKFYRRDSVVIYPGVDIERFKPTKDHKNYFVIVSQLTAYKKIDVAIRAFNRLNLPLIIIGDGPEKKHLQKIAGPTIEFQGFLSDEQITTYYQEARAFIFPGADDFGIAPIEAMAAGKPVLALRVGGATETIIEGKTGEFFDEPIMELLADGVRRLIENESKYKVAEIRQQAEKFSLERFDKEMKEYLQKEITNYNDAFKRSTS